MVKRRKAKQQQRTLRKPIRVNIHVYATKLRNNMTKAEVILWNELQIAMKLWGVVFESQGVVGGRFVADFVCRERMVIVEIDGSIHRLARIKAKDSYRTSVLIKLGYKILRFNNTEVFNHSNRVLKSIRRVVVRGS